MNEVVLRDLEKRAARMRLELLRTFSYGKAHHFGGSLSCVDLAAALYFYKMNYSKENFREVGRDRLVFSKGHSVPVQYVALVELGIHRQKDLESIKQMGSVFQGHPDMRKTAGVEAPTGSLGQGLSFANGIALGARHAGLDCRTYVILGDGELQEGQVWEAAMTTAHYKLGNVCAIIDRNSYQSQGSIDNLMGVEPLEKKFEAFGWSTRRIDGHNMEEICSALDAFDRSSGKPGVIIADTVKGKGISFMEHSHVYHNYSLTLEEYGQAEAQLLAAVEDLT